MGCWVGWALNWKTALGGAGTQGTATRPPSHTAGPDGATLSCGQSSQKRHCAKFHPTLWTQNNLTNWVSNRKQ